MINTTDRLAQYTAATAAAAAVDVHLLRPPAENSRNLIDDLALALAHKPILHTTNVRRPW